MNKFKNINEEFNKIIKTLSDEEYQEWYNHHLKQLIRREKELDLKCICCKEKVKVTVNAHEGNVLAYLNANARKGIIIAHSAGYGSRFDTLELGFSICDNCIEIKLKEELIAVLNKDYIEGLESA